MSGWTDYITFQHSGVPAATGALCSHKTFGLEHARCSPLLYKSPRSLDAVWARTTVQCALVTFQDVFAEDLTVQACYNCVGSIAGIPDTVVCMGPASADPEAGSGDPRGHLGLFLV